jgi:hypothetical protein
MNVVWHDNKTNAFSVHLMELMVENSQDDSFGMIQEQQSPATID